MPFTAIDDAPPSGFSPVEDDSKGFTPVDDGPAPEGVFQSFLRPIERYLPSSLLTAGAGLGAGALAAETGPGAVVADIAAGTAAGAGYEKARELAMKPGDIEAEQAQLAANEKANPWSSKIGTMIGQLPAFLGGGTGLFKGAKAAAEAAGTKFVPTALQEAAHMAAGGARSSGSEAAAANVDGQDVFIPEAITKGAITMGPLGFVSKIPGLANAATSYVGKTLQTLGHAAGSAEILAHSNALYNSVVNGTHYNEGEVQKTALSDAPAFALLGAAGHLAAGKPAHELDTPIAQAAEAGQPETAAALEKLKGQVEQKTGADAEPFPVPETEENNETSENRPVETNDKGDIGPSLLGTEGGGEVPPAGEADAETTVPDPFKNQPVEDNALPINQAGEILQREPEQAGSSGSERGGVEQGEQGEEAAPESVPPPQGADAQNGEPVKEFGIKNAVMDEYLKARGLPPVPEGTGADVVKRIADTHQAYVDNPHKAYELVEKFNDNPGVRPTVEEQGFLDNHFVSLDRQTKLAEIEAQNPNLSEEDRQKAANRAEVLDEHVGELADVARKLGTHWSDEGRARQVTLDQDYGVMRQLIRKTRLKGGNLTPEEIKQTRQESQAYEAQAKVIREMEKANEEADKVKGGEGVVEGVKKSPKAKKVTAEESQKSVEQKIKDALANKAALKGKSDEVQSSAPIPGEPPQEVTTEHQKQAVSDLQKTQVGKNLLKGAIIVPDWERAISHSELRSFSSDEINRIKQSEGFFDPQSGKVVVIRENIAPREGETGEQALKRVLIHERVGHEGSRWMLDNDPQFRKAYHDAASKIPQAELDAIAGRYGHLEGNSDALINEWFARNVENLKPGELPDPKTAFGKMWQAIKDFLARILGKSTGLDQQVRDLAQRILSSPDAFEGRKGLEGDLETQHALAPEEKNSLSDIPHSVLADLARHVVEFGHKAGEKMTEPELTKGMHDILKKSVPDVTESEVRRAHSKYGRVVNPTRDDIEKETNDLKAQQRLVEARTDAENNIRPKKTGAQREKPSQAQRDLDKQVRDLIKKKEEQKKFGEEDVANARATTLDAVKSRLNNTVEDLEKDIKDLKEGRPVRNRQRTPVERDQAAVELQKRVDSLRAERDNLKGAPELTSDQWNKRMIAATKRVTEELERRVKEKDFDAKKKPSFEANAELEAARQARDEAREALHQNEDYKKNAEQQAISQIKRRLATRIEQNEERIKNEDFAPKEKKKPFSDDEIELQKMKLLKQRQQILNGNRRLQLASRSKGKKFWDNVVKAKRALVLTSAAVYGKLASAALVRGGLTGLEDLQGGVLKHILPKSVTDKALIESGSSPKALAKGFTSAFMKGLTDSKDTVKTGQSELDLKHGKPKADDEIWHSFLGRLHGAVKAPVKRAAFEYALEKQARNYIAQGVDITEPLIQAKMAAKAYEYANKAIFMNDHAVATAWNLALDSMMKKGGGSAGIARALRILLPIVKVPLNIATEATMHVVGIPVGLGKMLKAYRAGIENLKPEEADAILSALKKGSLGSAVLLVGFFNPQMFGGYYQKGSPRKQNEPEYGGAKIGDQNVPKTLLHAPIFEIMQMGSTIRRVADSRLNQHSGQRGLTAGALAGALGLASEVPFINESLRLGDTQTPEGREKYFGELAKAQVLPAILDQYARARDKDAQGNPIKRKTAGFVDVLKSGIPGERETLPKQLPKK